MAISDDAVGISLHYRVSTVSSGLSCAISSLNAGNEETGREIGKYIRMKNGQNQKNSIVAVCN